MRIGELAERTGVSAATLRVWERRYGLLHPSRTLGGYRIYGPDDERRVRAVIALRHQGVSAGAAAARVLGDERAQLPEAPDDAAALADPAELVTRLLEATRAFDERTASDVLDDTFAGLSLERAISEVLLPYLKEVGDRWESGALSIAHEHFGSGLVRRRLSAYSSTWSLGKGPTALLACPPGEAHDIGLLAFGVLLGRAGWRVRFLGGDTPVADITKACDIVSPDVVVIAASRSSVISASTRPLRLLARAYPLLIGGRGANADAATVLNAHVLPQDPVAAVPAAAKHLRDRTDVIA
ncbi:MAG: MerR family transcriptional regulator [Actinomycetia bacterium]|nr:MerR family transcriptional regulator [Actinomycetes bacterium]